MRQKWSSPASISGVMNGAMGTMRAPSACSTSAALCTAAWMAGATGNPQPASRSRPMRRPRRGFAFFQAAAQSMVCAGRLMLSRASGALSTCISKAASATVRVMGPAARPM